MTYPSLDSRDSSFRILTQADWSPNTEEVANRVGSIKCLQRHLKRKEKKPSLNFRLTTPHALQNMKIRSPSLVDRETGYSRRTRARQKGHGRKASWTHSIADNPCSAPPTTRSQVGGPLNPKWQSANSLPFAPSALLTSNTGQGRTGPTSCIQYLWRKRDIKYWTKTTHHVPHKDHLEEYKMMEG